MENSENLIIKHIRCQDKNRAKVALANYTDYVSNLEEEVEKLREIVKDPNTEITSLREQIRQLNYKLAINSNYSFGEEARRKGEQWIREHYNNQHLKNDYMDYSFIITPTPLDWCYECRCNKCGMSLQVE